VLLLELAAGGGAALDHASGGRLPLSGGLIAGLGTAAAARGAQGGHRCQRAQYEQYDKMPHAYLSAVRGRNFGAAVQRLPMAASALCIGAVTFFSRFAVQRAAQA